MFPNMLHLKTLAQKSLWAGVSYFFPRCLSVCHFCQLPSVFEPLLPTILQKEAEVFYPCTDAQHLSGVGHLPHSPRSCYMNSTLAMSQVALLPGQCMFTKPLCFCLKLTSSTSLLPQPCALGLVAVFNLPPLVLPATLFLLGGSAALVPDPGFSLIRVSPTSQPFGLTILLQYCTTL